ncbi:hypothetical protein ALC57_08343, partial [Trachymyrmex cornetzi]
TILNVDIPFFYRYVDDICTAVLPSNIDNLLEMFNSFHPRLQFTLELGGERLEFLDTTIIISNKKFVFDWYRKSTFSGRFLNFHSNHPIAQKKDTIFSLVDRAFLLSDFTLHKKNLTFIINILLDNDYTLTFIFNMLIISLLINHIKYNASTRSVITEHRLQYDHDFQWDNVRVLDEEPCYRKRLTSEMLNIKKQTVGLNLQNDTEGLHKAYTLIINKL